MDSFDELVGTKIRFRRNELGQSQEQLAKASGVTFQQVQKYEKGKNRVAASRLVRIAEALQVQPTYFFPLDPKFGAAPCGELELMRESFGSEDRRKLNRAFGQIEAPALRKAIVRLVEALAEGRTGYAVEEEGEGG